MYVVYIYMHKCVIYEYVAWLFLNFISYALAATRAKRAEPNKNVCCKFFFRGFFFLGFTGYAGSKGCAGFTGCSVCSLATCVHVVVAQSCCRCRCCRRHFEVILTLQSAQVNTHKGRLR